MDVNKDVRIIGYFSKPKGVREQNGLGNTVLGLKYIQINQMKGYLQK